MKLTQSELFLAVSALTQMIERCGASTELTSASLFSIEIRQAIGNEYNPPCGYAAARVLGKINKELPP